MSLRVNYLLATVLTIFVSSSVNAASATAEEVKAIARLYSAAFDREPKIDGLNFWVDRYEGGQGIVSIALRFYDSPEFSKKFGELSKVQYVRQLFRNVLGREGKQSGIDFWVGQVDKGKSRAWVLFEFSDSPENVAKTSSLFADMRYENEQWVFQPGTDSVQRFTSLSAGTGHSCVLDKGDAVCWGDNSYGQLAAPVLKNPMSICAGGAHTCALDDSGVHCWGAGTPDSARQWDAGQSIVPMLTNPSSVSCGLWTTCALDDNGVHCWGMAAGQMDMSLANPTIVAAGNNATCAGNSEIVECRAARFPPGTLSDPVAYECPDLIERVPTLIGLKMIAVGSCNACATHRDGIVCWGHDEFGVNDAPPTNNPIDIGVGVGWACARDENGIVCWGVDKSEPPPFLDGARSLAVGDYHACAAVGESIVCWGGDNWGQSSVPEYLRED